MILTAQEELGLRCALTLARAQQYAERHGDGDGALTLAQIAATEGMSSAYAGKVVRALVQAGLVDSTRGRAGGYTLAKPARDITAAATLTALGSKIYDGRICSPDTGDAGLCVHDDDCTVRSLWSGLQHLIDRYLEQTTLAGLIGDERSVAESVSQLLAARP